MRNGSGKDPMSLDGLEFRENFQFRVGGAQDLFLLIMSLIRNAPFQILKSTLSPAAGKYRLFRKVGKSRWRVFRTILRGKYVTYDTLNGLGIPEKELVKILFSLLDDRLIARDQEETLFKKNGRETRFLATPYS